MLAKALSVQEQNAIIEHNIYATAIYWRENKLPHALIEYGKKKGLLWDRTIILRLAIDFPGMPNLWGTILTDRGRFIDFELDTDDEHKNLNSIELWQDVTDLQNFSKHNKGTGIGYGELALGIHRKLCGEI